MDAKLNKLIQERYSTRAFSSQKVESEKIRLLIDAARWAASSYNEQPARYIIGEKGDEMYEKIFNTLMPPNQVWNKQVPLLIMTLVKIDSKYTGKTNYYATHDLGLAIGNLSLQATDMGLYVHQMGGFDKELARSNFNIPNELTPVSIIAVGYPGNLSDLPEEFQKIEQTTRTRNQYEKTVFTGNWEELL